MHLLTKTDDSADFDGHNELQEHFLVTLSDEFHFNKHNKHLKNNLATQSLDPRRRPLEHTALLPMHLLQKIGDFSDFWWT